MESGGNCSSSISDWDRPLTDQELQAIDLAFQSATPPPTKRRRLSTRNHERRLPESICNTPRRVSDSFSPLPYPRNSFFNAYKYNNSSSRAKLMMRCPTITFKGRIIYGRTVSEVEKAAKELLEFVESKKKGMDQVILGFDIEWRPTFRRGASPGKVAVMQICGDTGHCYVMHIIHSGIPQNLRSLLEDPTSVKVGVGISNDAFKVFNDYSVSIKSLEELSGLANQKFGGNPKKWSLASLTEKLICKQLPKPEKIRKGNWEADILSNEQLQYAATDAFASWYLFEALKSLPDASVPADNKNKELENLP